MLCCINARALLVTTLLLAGAPAVAQDLKLDDLVAEALQRNPELLAVQKKYEAARQRPSQAAALPDPVFSPGWNSNGNPLPGAQLGTNPTSNIGFAITQEIPFPGKQRLRGDIARKEADAQFEDLQLSQLSVISRVKQAFFRLQHSWAAREVLERNRELITTLLSITEVRYASGRVQQQDVFKAQVQLSLLETKVVQLEREQRLRQAELNSLLNRTPDTPMGKPAEPHIGQMAGTLAELQAAAVQNSPLRLRDEKMTRRADLAVNLARKDYYPDYALSGGYYNQGGMPAFYTFRADIRIPVNFRARQRAALTEQSQLLSSARHSYQATAQSLNLRVADDYSSTVTSKRLMDLYRNTIIPQMRLAAESSLTSYETGAVDFLTVLSNFAAALDYEMNYHDEMQNYHLALSRLEETTGMRLIEEDHQ